MERKPSYEERYNLGLELGEKALEILNDQARLYLPYVVLNAKEEDRGFAAGMVIYGALEKAIKETYGYKFTVEDVMKYFNYEVIKRG